MKFIQLVMFLAFFSFEAQSATVGKSPDFTIHQQYISPRAMAMGNAFSAVVDDHSAIFYNPAALARRKNHDFVGYIKGGFSNSFGDLTNEISNIGGTGSEADQITAFNSFLNSQIGNSYNAAGSLGGFWTSPNWGIAVIPVDFSTDMTVRQSVGPSLSVNTYLNSTVAFSYAKDVNWLGKDKGKLSAGYTVKGANQIYFPGTISSAELAAGNDVMSIDNAAEGFFADVDLGLLYTPLIPTKGFFKFFKWAKPSFSLVMRNVLDLDPVTNLHVVDPESQDTVKVQRRIDVGSKWDLPNFWVFDPSFSFEVRDMLHENFSLTKGIHAGAELFWKVTNWWKGSWAIGVNHGYLTAGIGARFTIFSLDYVTYADEMGTENFKSENRKHMIQMSLKF